LQTLDQFEPHRSAHDKDAAVPPESARCNVLRRELERRLLNEPVDAVGAFFEFCAKADIAESSVGPRGRHAECGDRAALRILRGMCNGLLKCGRVENRVIGRHGHQDRVFTVAGGDCSSQRQRRRGIAPRGFDHEVRGDPARAQLLRRHETMFIAADDDRCRPHRPLRRESFQSPDRVLQQRMRADHVDQLLRIVFARKGPQPGTRAAGQNHGGNAQTTRRWHALCQTAGAVTGATVLIGAVPERINHF